ncbi:MULTISPECIES: hypothetical protein [Microbacterium]|uniref:hypothetical protein n=1 Tax=Microbacterium TaxID=33882 RepID=UPI00217DB205|nr:MULTISPECIES: hypothetical protein [Microbacterium]UWF78129.1 hypothetical protein JSY13_03610 [Microbacterium neungamense]WCM56306.1 hypothetical protein JRG78_03630 [Microbacterium sp. EF45047]
MAHRGVSRGIRSWARLPVVARIAIVYLLARVITTGFLLAAAGISTSLSRFGADAGLADFVLGWDAQWYWWVAENGYPRELPRTASGDVAENAWAFMPVYAYLAKLVGFGVWGAGALTVSLVSGFLACLALHGLLRDRIGESAAMWAVTFFAMGPLAALFQVGYAEALFVLLLLIALDLVSRHRYGWLYALVPVMGFTRPGILAFALFLGLHGIARWRRRRAEPLPGRDAVHIVAMGALATMVGFSWQVIAGIVTGEPGAYLQTELSWRRNWIAEPVTQFVPFEGFVQAADFWFSQWGMPGWWGWVVLVLLVAGTALLLLRGRAVRRLGVDVRLWSASYLLYLLAVFFPQSSTFRLLMPLTPLWGAVAVPRPLGYRIGVLLACLAGQWVWILNMYGLAQTFWQVP